MTCQLERVDSSVLRLIFATIPGTTQDCPSPKLSIKRQFVNLQTAYTSISRVEIESDKPQQTPSVCKPVVIRRKALNHPIRLIFARHYEVTRDAVRSSTRTVLRVSLESKRDRQPSRKGIRGTKESSKAIIKERESLLRIDGLCDRGSRVVRIVGYGVSDRTIFPDPGRAGSEDTVSGAAR